MQKSFINQSLKFLIAASTLWACTETAKITTSELRAPVFTLIKIDPYTSAWSESDQMFDSPVSHWTRETHPLIEVIRVDGQVYHFMGKEDIPLKMMLPMANEGAWDGKLKQALPKRDESKTILSTGSGLLAKVPSEILKHKA